MDNIASQKILIIRNDKLGDFMLSLPVFKLMKEALPESSLHALVPNYTRDIALACNAIDDVVIDPGKNASLLKQWQLLKIIRQHQYDAVITLFSTTRIGCITWLSGIPYRLAPATKVAQLFYNHRIRQKRSRSEKPEYCYNLDLAYKYLADCHVKQHIQPSAPFLDFPHAKVVEQKQLFLHQQKIKTDPKLIIIHPGSGGSARNLSLDQYAQLVQLLQLSRQYHIVITAGPDETENAEHLSHLLKNIPNSVYHSNSGLINFSQFLQSASLFISGSTGPLHIAGALDIPTVGFYPRRRSATALRWQTLNSDHKRLGFMPPESLTEEDMQGIDLSSAAELIRKKFLL